VNVVDTKLSDGRNIRSYRGLNKFNRAEQGGKMRKLITALVASATVIAGSLVGTARATTVTGVGSLPSLTKNSSPVANVACWCGQYQCACRGPVRSAVRGTVRGTGIAARGVVVGTGAVARSTTTVARGTTRGAVVGTGAVARSTTTVARGTGRGAWCILTLGHCGSPVPPGY
jgi:hypothetical protein